MKKGGNVCKCNTGAFM